MYLVNNNHPMLFQIISIEESQTFHQLFLLLMNHKFFPLMGHLFQLTDHKTFLILILILYIYTISYIYTQQG